MLLALTGTTPSAPDSGSNFCTNTKYEEEGIIYYEGTVIVSLEDITGDEVPEYLINISAPRGHISASYGLFLTFLCPDGSTAVHGFMQDAYLEDSGYEVSVSDVAGVGYPQLLILFKGAPEGWACRYTHVLLTAPRSTSWEILLETQPIEFDSTCTVTFENTSGKVSQDIVLEGYRSGGGSTYPSRNVLEAYSWNKDKSYYELSRREYLPSAYRIHILEDAQHAIDDGKIGKALSLYRIAIYDPLIDVPSNGEPEIAPSVYYGQDTTPNLSHYYQTQFAKFRSVVLLESLDYREKAEKILQSMLSPTDPGGEFTEMTELFINLVDQGMPLSQACNEVAKQITDKYPRLSGYDGHMGSWGSGVVFYNASNLCPKLPEP